MLLVLQDSNFLFEVCHLALHVIETIDGQVAFSVKVFEVNLEGLKVTLEGCINIDFIVVVLLKDLPTTFDLSNLRFHGTDLCIEIMNKIFQ